MLELTETQVKTIRIALESSLAILSQIKAWGSADVSEEIKETKDALRVINPKD